MDFIPPPPPMPDLTEPSPVAAPVEAHTRCGHCSTERAKNKCLRCLKVVYCSAECQKVTFSLWGFPLAYSIIKFLATTLTCYQHYLFFRISIIRVTGNSISVCASLPRRRRMHHHPLGKTVVVVRELVLPLRPPQPLLRALLPPPPPPPPPLLPPPPLPPTRPPQRTRKLLRMRT